MPRTQKSVFEGEISLRRLADLEKVFDAEIDHEEDTIRVYKLCKRCRTNVEGVGIGRAGAVDAQGDIDEIIDN